MYVQRDRKYNRGHQGLWAGMRRNSLYEYRVFVEDKERVLDTDDCDIYTTL